MINKKSKLKYIEKKYCSCLVKVRRNKIKNPYGICTKSIYGSRKKKRNKVIRCLKEYDLNKLSYKQLKLLALEKKIKIKLKSKKSIINKLKYKNKKLKEV